MKVHYGMSRKSKATDNLAIYHSLLTVFLAETTLTKSLFYHFKISSCISNPHKIYPTFPPFSYLPIPFMLHFEEKVASIRDSFTPAASSSINRWVPGKQIASFETLEDSLEWLLPSGSQSLYPSPANIRWHSPDSKSLVCCQQLSASITPIVNSGTACSRSATQLPNQEKPCQTLTNLASKLNSRKRRLRWWPLTQPVHHWIHPLLVQVLRTSGGQL